MFQLGNYSYGERDDVNNNGEEGVIVYYLDNNGTEWSSDLGSGLQTRSTFTIVEHIDNNDGFSEEISKATFNCTLYDGNGNSKTLTNGELRSRNSKT